MSMVRLLSGHPIATAVVPQNSNPIFTTTRVRPLNMHPDIGWSGRKSVVPQISPA
jgi:hypothetical protein